MKDGALHEIPGGWVWTRLDIRIINLKECKGVMYEKRTEVNDSAYTKRCI
jgi:hypothetical protein